MVYERSGYTDKLSIPSHRELHPGIVRDLISTMGLTVDEFLALVRR